MFLAALRDLQWRRRRFLIAIVGTGLVFAMSLVGSGLSAAFRNEMTRSIRDAGADRWLVPTGSTGPLTGLHPFPMDLASQAAALPGVKEADPIVFARSAIDTGNVVDVNLFGVVPGGVGAARPTKGTPITAPGEAVVDSSAGVPVGHTLRLGGRDFRVVGTLSGATMFAGAPNVYIHIEDAQQLLLGGQPLATSVLTRGVPAAASLPGAVKAMTAAEVRADALRILKNALSTIDFVNVLLWLVAVTIMGSILYLTAIERTRDIAVFKATGAPTSRITLGMALQAVLLALGSSILAIALSFPIAWLFPVTPEIPFRAYVAIPLVAVVVGLLAGLVAMRRAVRVEPALAFGG